jgi:hypothetical protein
MARRSWSAGTQAGIKHLSSAKPSVEKLMSRPGGSTHQTHALNLQKVHVGQQNTFDKSFPSLLDALDIDHDYLRERTRVQECLT